MKKLLFLEFALVFILTTFVLAQSDYYIRPGEVIVTWTTITLNVCPPGIFGKGPCEFVSILEIIQRLWNFYLYVAPFLLTFLVILGGFYFLLITFKPEFRDIGWRYIKNAILGYIILLIISGIFTFIRFIFGGPGF